MKPFGLEVVLGYRKRQEDLARLRLVNAQNQEAMARAALEKSRQKLTELLQGRTKSQEQGIGIDQLIRYEQSIELTATQIQGLEKTLVEKQQAVERERAHLAEKSKQRQIMERLKEHQNSAWRRYLDKKEAAMLDEIAIIKHDSAPQG